MLKNTLRPDQSHYKSVKNVLFHHVLVFTRYCIHHVLAKVPFSNQLFSTSARKKCAIFGSMGVLPVTFFTIEWTQSKILQNRNQCCKVVLSNAKSSMIERNSFLHGGHSTS